MSELVLQLSLVGDLESTHDLWVLDELLDEFILLDIALSLENFIVIKRVTLDCVVDPLEQEERHLVLVAYAKHLEWILIGSQKLLAHQVMLITFRHELVWIILAAGLMLH